MSAQSSKRDGWALRRRGEACQYPSGRRGPTLIHGIAYQEGKKIADIDVASISDYLKGPDCFV